MSHNVDITVPDIAALHNAYRSGALDPRTWLRQQLATARQDAHNAWIYLLDDAELAKYIDALDGHSPDTKALYGVPFAIKDNIDLAGVPTTAACPEFAYTPEQSATVVQLLIDAGAIPIGKTNMDQFATGLVGTRSPEPWGPCKNSLNPTMISGGSSAGSAVAVALGYVSFSLGTDTAGSGRVPAALNNIVGVKPSRGLLSTHGVVPACASLDCVTVFALNCEDANTLLDVVAQYDSQDCWSRRNSFANGSRYFSKGIGPFRFGVPKMEQLEFFGDKRAAIEFHNARRALEAIGGAAIELDFSPLFEAANLLYQGPWVTERYLAVQPLMDTKPEAMLPVIQQIIGSAKKHTAQTVFRAQYQLQTYRNQTDELMADVDVLVTPTVACAYAIDEVLADPIQLNSNLGYYTNFMNLLDLAAVAVPTGRLDSGVGFGVTLFHRALRDKRLLSLACELAHHLNIPPGVFADADIDIDEPPYRYRNIPTTHVPVVVCGAHLDGQPLNWQLIERGARFREKTKTVSGYQLYALAGGPPLRPGMVIDSNVETQIEVEVWELPVEHFGSFVAEIPAPLGIGKVRLASGEWLPGFICEASGLVGAENISRWGGWRAWLAGT